MDFALLFPEMSVANTNNEPEVYITTPSSPYPTVTIYGPNIANTAVTASFIPQFPGTFKALPGSFRASTSGIGSNGIRAYSDGNAISLVGFNKEASSSEGYLAIPIDSLGKEYYAVTCPPVNTDQAYIGVVAVFPFTTVSFAFPPGKNIIVNYNGQIYRSGQVLTVLLNPWQTFQMYSQTDLSGTHIYANTNLAAFSGNANAVVGSGSTADHLIVQLIPVDTWGKTFAVQKFGMRTDGYKLQIVTGEPDTMVFLSSEGSIPVRQVGDVVSRDLNDLTYIVSDKPVMVIQTSKSQSSSSSMGDASMVLIPANDHYMSEYVLTTPDASTGPFTCYLQIICQSNNINGLVLTTYGQGNENINFNGWTTVPSSNPVLLAKTISINPGIYKVYHTSGAVFQAVLYGEAVQESFGVPLGMKLAIINSKVCTS